MINLVFTSNRKVVRFEIEGRGVRYFDDLWKDGIQIYPMDRLQVKKMVFSRRPSVSAVGLLITDANSGKNFEEYEACKTEEDIAEIIRKDCLIKGLKEVGHG